MYKQVTEQITHAIATGSLVPGTRLPSIREMAQELRVSQITIKRAYSDLEREGYIIARTGLGSFVAGIDKEGLRAKRMSEIRNEVERLVTAAEKTGISAREIGKIVKEIREGSDRERSRS